MTARDVFICHASPDKQEYARPLARALGSLSVSCWLDEALIEAGDSISDSISDGLRLARYVVVLVTSEMLRRSWPRQELDAALSREKGSEGVVIIPILVAPEEEWHEAFPILADKHYLSWRDGLPSISEDIARRFSRKPAVDWAFEHPEAYVGPIWLRCTPSSNDVHDIVIYWGPLVKRLQWRSPSSEPWSMVHHKLYPDSHTMHVQVNPAAIVTAGHGPPPDEASHAFNIDEGWTRAAGPPVRPVPPPTRVPSPKERKMLADHLGEDP